MDKTLEELIIFLESCNFSITPFRGAIIAEMNEEGVTDFDLKKIITFGIPFTFLKRGIFVFEKRSLKKIDKIESNG